MKLGGFMDIKNNMFYHEKNLNKYATYDKEAIRFKEIEDDIRPNFFRDSDRIIHSLSFTRYSDKTQVFSNNNNDHISKRIIHVQLVSKIARTIGRALKLNEDLIEAIALGHDLGHVPFGHVGERILNNLSIQHNQGIFIHNIQSVRTLMYLENKGNGCNLTIQVLDGIMCHNGEKLLKKYTYKSKSKEEFINEYKNSYKDKNFANNLIPMTLEACVVRISDIIGYIGRDLDDAFLVGKLNEDIIPKNIKEVLGGNNKEIVNNLILDIINCSYEKNYIAMSDKVYDALNELIKFNYDNIYLKANTHEEVLEYELMFNTLFDKCLYILDNNLNNYNIFIDYLDRMNEDYKNNNSNVRIVLDFIAGMTDTYFINEFNTLKKI
ncbi:MAG: HD domain-containing protein [Bacilli bacterium]|nr:HD domain-containing protein [Bacilli bacterium]